VATTRPETMLGDVAVAVHPDDERYKQLVGKHAILPLVGRRIPIIADEYSDPEKGTGAVKITPAHDFNDFEVGKRHNLPLVNIFDTEAKLKLSGNQAFLAHVRGANDTAETDELIKSTIDTLDGLDRFIARKKILERLEARALLEKAEPQTSMVPHGDRSGVVIEPYLTNQWYVDAKTLAQPAMAAVRAGRTVFVPRSWEANYFGWMENIQPWCISRQLWWGHRIPAWYGRKEVGPREWASVFDDPEIFVADNEEEAVHMARQKYGCDVRVLSRPPSGELDPVFKQIIDDELGGKPRWEPIWRDEDVLDTWFSSALWPFSTLGWPDESPELKRYYPTDTLVTSFDIIFFWVARMMMMGLHFMEEVPFRTVYIHALVRDARGAKMSKSKGNVVDPIPLIEEYGADALRFTLAAMAAPGRDIKLDIQRVASYRNFATKLWNACRFAEMNNCATVPSFDPRSAEQTVNRWIMHETANAAGVITLAIEEYRFNDAAAMAYVFVWNIYCDWYLELAKPVLLGQDGSAKDETRATVAWARDQILKLLHPSMPFVTEELWRVTEHRPQLLALTDWPRLASAFEDTNTFSDAGAEAEIGWLIDLITAIRSVRAAMNINTQIPLVLVGAGSYTREHAEYWGDSIKRLARISDIAFADTPPPGSVQIVARSELAALPLKGVIDFAAEKARLQKDLARVNSDIARIDAKLTNAHFLSRAPEDVIEEERERREEAEARRSRITEALQRLESAA